VVDSPGYRGVSARAQDFALYLCGMGCCRALIELLDRTALGIVRNTHHHISP